MKDIPWDMEILSVRNAGIDPVMMKFMEYLKNGNEEERKTYRDMMEKWEAKNKESEKCFRCDE